MPPLLLWPYYCVLTIPFCNRNRRYHWQNGQSIVVLRPHFMSRLVLSLFPGVGLLDRAFHDAGFCVVQVADKITGGDVRTFTGIRRRFDGIIAGPPCQGFSIANSFRLDDTHPSVVASRELLQHTCRIISECQPSWFLIENVPCVPDVRVEGYYIQRVSISDFECGGLQLRCRHVQFGSIKHCIIRPVRVNDCAKTRKKGRPADAVTTKTRHSIDYPDLCRRQGLDVPISLPGWSRMAKFKAVGNGVPLKMGAALANAVVHSSPFNATSDCPCGCGRTKTYRAITATAACRKRKQIASQRSRPWIDLHGYHVQ